jgi:integrase
MKGDGLYRRGEVWWVTWVTPDGKRHRVSTGRRYHQEAKTERDRIVGDVANGRPVVAPGRTTLTQLGELIVADYTTRQNRSLPRMKGALKQLKAYFGKRPAASISWGDAVQYRKQRTEAGLSVASVNYELAILRRMLRLAVRDGKLIAAPPIDTPDPKNARKGFVEREDLDTVLEKLPKVYRGPVLFAYLTGWRCRSEVLPLRWPQVNVEAGTVRLEPGTTKNGRGRMFPFGGLPELKTLLDGQRAAAAPGVPWVFHEDRHAVRYKDLLTAWRAACAAAEVRHILHDLRRSAVRNLERAGVARSRAMKLTGHETESVYARYAIADERDLREAVEQLARVTVESQSGSGDKLSL